MKTQWQLHQRWKKCKDCELCEKRKNVVLARGSIPCDVLFIGEAPGASEDVIGIPFVGPAGKLLDSMINKSGFDLMDHDIVPIRKAFTNLVACIPKVETNAKIAEPPKESIEACAERLLEFIRICNPKVIVCAGDLPAKWIPKLLGITNDANRGAKKTSASPSKSSDGNRLSKRGQAVETTSNQRPAKHPIIVNIIHPAAIIRMDKSQQGLAIQRTVAILSDIVLSIDRG